MKERKPKPQPRQLILALAFLNKICFEERALSSDDIVDRCRLCGQEAWTKNTIKHKSDCEVGKILNYKKKE